MTFDDFDDDFSAPAIIMQSQPAVIEKIDYTGMRGVFYDVSNEDYHACKSVSKSVTDAINKSAGYAWAYMNGLIKRNESEALNKGTLLHCAILEPDELYERYFLSDKKPDMRTKAGKALAEEIRGQANGKRVITPDHMTMITRVSEEIHKHPIARLLFDGGRPEVSIFSEMDGAPVRCRHDYLNGQVVADLKSTEDASQDGFLRSVEKYRYDVQDAFYRDVSESQGVDVSNFLFVAVEKSEPYRVEVYELDAESVNWGRTAYKANLETYRRCMQTGIWPSTTGRITPLSTSNFHRKRIERSIELAL